MPQGCFVTLEGGEGAGKSTQIRRLGEHLRERNFDVIETREPGGAKGAEMIRALLVDGPTDSWDPISETLLHFAARREHLVKTVLPALDRGAWVLSDRFVDSTMAYQGYAQGVDFDVIHTLYQMVAGDLLPDLTIILDLPVDTGLERAEGRGEGGTRYERMGQDFHKKLRQGFLEMAASDPDRYAIIDAELPIDKVSSEILALVETRLIDAART
jgi:dTMP kinase